MANHVIYIPGLGDQRALGQDKVLKFWKLLGLQPHYLALGWDKKEGVDVKLARVLEMIDTLKKEGDSVSLVGVSAGASVVLNAYAQRKDLRAVICICGKINHPKTVSNKVYSNNPDFEESMLRVKQSLSNLNEDELKKILSLHPWRDQTVPVADTKIKGAVEKTAPGWNHVTGIFSGITFAAPAIAKFIRSQK